MVTEFSKLRQRKRVAWGIVLYSDNVFTCFFLPMIPYSFSSFSIPLFTFLIPFPFFLSWVVGGMSNNQSELGVEKTTVLGTH